MASLAEWKEKHFPVSEGERTEFLRRIEKLLIVEPTLSDYGFGVFDYAGKSPAAIEAEIKLNQDRLRDSVDDVVRCYNFLIMYVVPTKTITMVRTSYGMKHSVERQIGYITNGVFIAAAKIAGFRGKLPRAGSPNMHFNMSKKSWVMIDKMPKPLSL